METKTNTAITVETVVNAPIAKVWSHWNEPQHITKWCQASADWHAPYAENDLREGGSFKTTMAARDGSMQFDFAGVYSAVKQNQLIQYGMSDGRKVSVTFTETADGVKITETFDAESTHSLEMQRAGWQAILESFKQYVESN